MYNTRVLLFFLTIRKINNNKGICHNRQHTEVCISRGSVQTYDRDCGSDKHPVASCMQQSALQVKEPITSRVTGFAYGMLLSWSVHYSVWEVK